MIPADLLARLQEADPDLQKAGVVWDRPTPWAARRKAGSPGRYAKETEDVEMDSMTDDILAQAEEAHIDLPTKKKNW